MAQVSVSCGSLVDKQAPELFLISLADLQKPTVFRVQGSSDTPLAVSKAGALRDFHLTFKPCRFDPLFEVSDQVSRTTIAASGFPVVAGAATDMQVALWSKTLFDHGGNLLQRGGF